MICENKTEKESKDRNGGKFSYHRKTGCGCIPPDGCRLCRREEKTDLGCTGGRIGGNSTEYFHPGLNPSGLPTGI